jgi:hypothetical protein
VLSIFANSSSGCLYFFNILSDPVQITSPV